MREISLTSAGLSPVAGKPARVDTTRKTCRRVEAIALEIGEAICRDVVKTLENNERSRCFFVISGNYPANEESSIGSFTPETFCLVRVHV
jgi:hypothetical protein